VLYSDSLVKVTDEGIIFKHYFFPFGSKRVEFTRIEAIEAKIPSFGEKWRLWGTGNFRSWFPLDWTRPSRDKIFVAILRDSSWRIYFTVENSVQFAEVLKDHGMPMRDPLA